jgi:hypothetical protein
MGLNFAVAFTGFDGKQEPIDDPTIGEIVFNHYKWGSYTNGTLYSGRYRLNSHRCSRKELGLEDGDDNFEQSVKMFTTSQYAKRDIEMNHKRFFCPNKEDLRIYGDYNTESAQIFNV